MTNRIIARALGAASILALAAGCGLEVDVGSEQEAPKAAPLSVEDARAFVEEVETTLAAKREGWARTQWVNATNITFDTDWLASRAGAESTELGVKFANEAKRFNDLELPDALRRKLERIKLGVNVPAPSRPGAALDLAEIETRLSSTYETGKIELDGAMVPRTDLEEMMGTVRDPERLAEIWTKWREVPVARTDAGTTMKDDYAAMVALGNEGARELGFADLGGMWRARYELDPQAFVEETDRLWGQVKPLYEALHCHVRAKLNEQYGDDVVPLDQPIRADLLGNMWAQEWGSIYDIVGPETSGPAYDLTQLLEENGYTPVKMVETGEAFFSSLGFAPLPETFWERSLIEKPRDREVACHASAWNIDGADDIRIKMCTKVNAGDFQTVHHELGHNYYQRAYKNQDVLFKSGANGGFHEAIGDMIGLSITPEYLRQIGLLEETPDASADVGLLLQQALDKVAFLPFGLLMDKWRWQVFAGELTPETYNEGWWRLREDYQGLRPVDERDAKYFDAGGKAHIPGNTSYTRYFLARILQFQFYKAACDEIGWEGPLHRCSFYGEEAMGEKFNAMLELGASQPWPDALQTFTGTREMDGSAMVAYFAPLMDWLEEQNEGRQCGW